MHQDMRRWVGRKCNPERFDLDDNHKAGARAIRRSKSTCRFRQEKWTGYLSCRRPDIEFGVTHNYRLRGIGGL